MDERSNIAPHVGTHTHSCRGNLMVDVDHDGGLADRPHPACTTKCLDLLLKKLSNLQDT